MGVPEPLRNSPFRMYRRASLHTGLYGTNYSGPTRPPGDFTDSSGVPIQSAASPTPKTYLSGIHDEYPLHPGPMQMPMKDYRPYDASMVGNLPRLVQPTIPEELPMAALPLEGIEDIDLSELEAYLVDEQFNGPELAPSDNTEAAHEFMRIRAGEEVSEFANDLRAQLLEIQMAVEQIRTEPSAYTNPEPREFGLAIPQDFFEQQKQMLESQFDVLEPPEFDYGTQMEAAFDAQEALFDLFQPEAVPMEEMEPLAGSGSESLEQIIEAHEMLDEGVMPDAMPGALDDDDSLMSPDLFEEEMEPMGLYPDTFEDYGGMMPQEMYDEQMQEDPYMVPGSFGPGPMLDPGPGGPP